MRGHVLEEGSGEPIEGAIVTILGQDASPQVTNAAGSFTTYALAEGDVVLEISIDRVIVTIKLTRILGCNAPAVGGSLSRNRFMHQSRNNGAYAGKAQARGLAPLCCSCNVIDNPTASRY